MVIWLHGGIKNELLVSESNTKAEFGLLSTSINEVLWTTRTLSDLKVPYEEPIKLLCDYKLAIILAHDPNYHDKTKHVEID